MRLRQIGSFSQSSYVDDSFFEIYCKPNVWGLARSRRIRVFAERGVSSVEGPQFVKRNRGTLRGVVLVVLMVVVMIVMMVMVMVVMVCHTLIVSFLNQAIRLVGQLCLLHRADRVGHAGQRRRLGQTYVAKR
jgi:hypothetical protein